MKGIIASIGGCLFGVFSTGWGVFVVAHPATVYSTPLGYLCMATGLICMLASGRLLMLLLDSR